MIIHYSNITLLFNICYWPIMFSPPVDAKSPATVYEPVKLKEKAIPFAYVSVLSSFNKHIMLIN